MLKNYLIYLFSRAKIEKKRKRTEKNYFFSIFYNEF